MAGLTDDSMTGSATALNVGNVETAAGNAAGSDPATPPAPAENHTQESSRHFPAAAVPAAPPVVTSTAATASATAGETAPACPHSMTVVAEEGAPPDSVTSSTHAASQSAPSTAGLSTAPTQISPPPPPPPLSAAAGSSGSESSSSACTAPSPTSPPPYLAAGVLPFCILGGDLLFLLGQELRFRSRVRGGTCAAMRGFSTPGVGGAVGESEDRGASGAPRKLPPSLGVPLRRPRRGPRPKLSLPTTTSSGKTSARDGGALRVLAPSEAAPSPPPGTTRVASNGQPTARGAMVPPLVVGANSEQRACQGSSHSSLHDTEAKGGGVDSSSAEADDRDAHPDTTRTGTSPDGFNARDNETVAAGVPGKPSLAAAASTQQGETERPRPCREQFAAAAPGQATVPAGLLWSDFGGGREAGDADAEDTAGREFAEESFGMFHGVRLDGDSVARSQATMSSALRNPSLRGKRVFESRNGGYVMYVAEVDFVPDLMMNLARKEIVNGNGSDGSGRGGEGRTSPPSPGFSEKTDFAWVPASILVGAMRESRNRSTRKVVVKLGGGRYLRLFHKFVISLWGLDLPAMVRAALTPLRLRRPSLPPPRVLLLKTDAGSKASNADYNCRNGSSTTAGWSDGNGGTGAGGKCAIRGIDCVRPSFLSGRKRTSLGIIEVGRGRRLPPERSDSGGSGSEVKGDTPPGDGAGVSGDRGRDGDGRRRSRSKKSGAACRKRRRQCKAARRLKAAATVAAAAAAVEAARAAAESSARAVIPARIAEGVEAAGEAVGTRG